MLRRVLGLTVLVLLFPLAGLPAQEGASETPPVVEVTALDYAFDAPDTIPSGWVTFRMKNEGEETHHFHLDRLPEGRTLAEWREDYKEPADSIFQLLAEDQIDLPEAVEALDQVTASWTDSVQTHGGVGVVAPGRTGQITQRVEPGRYVLICLIRAPSGLPHAGFGMVDGVVAVESSAGRSSPKPDVTARGVGREIRVDGTLTPGTQTIGFHAEEVPEEFRDGTDGYYSVWFARLSDTTDMRDVIAWDFNNPAPYEGLGGFEYLPSSEAVYVTADIDPGRYALLWYYAGMVMSEEYEPFVKTFTVE